MSFKTFRSKILLFGEYSIIRDNMALSIPYNLFEGCLDFKKNKASDREFVGFLQYLNELDKKKLLSFELDLEKLGEDIQRGLYFRSSIPRGHGVGSSGALCAAVFYHYVKDKDKIDKDISSLKKYFSELESYFHGASSGLDPLISYLNSSILINNGSIGTIVLPKFLDGEGAIFLLNTEKERRTEPLVNLFLEKCKSKNFVKMCDNVLSPITKNCLQAFLSGDMSSLYEFIRELSDFQFRFFNPMIPKIFNELWKTGLKTEEFYLKLCGAGGGGFILGMTHDFNRLQVSLKDRELLPILRF